MPEDPKYRLGTNDRIDPEFWTENLKTVLDALNGTIEGDYKIKQDRLSVTGIPIPLIDGGNLDL